MYVSDNSFALIKVHHAKWSWTAETAHKSKQVPLQSQTIVPDKERYLVLSERSITQILLVKTVKVADKSKQAPLR